MSRHQGTFRWSREMGAALRELRCRAGLTQMQVAEAMGGRGSTGHVAVSRLETGRAKQPTFGFVADYLRACGASFADLAPVLDAYTSQPTIASERVRVAAAKLAETLPPEAGVKFMRYAVKSRVADDEKTSADERFERLRRTARSLMLCERLETCLHDTVSRFGLGLVEFGQLCAYGRAVWGALSRARNRRRGVRAGGLEAVERRYGAVGTDEQRAAVRAAVQELFASLEQSGELDRLPGAAEAAELLDRKQVGRAERRCVREAAEQVDAESLRRWKAIEELAGVADRLLAAAGVAERARRCSRAAVATWWHILSHTAEATSARQKLVDEQGEKFRARGLDSELFLRMGELVQTWFRNNDCHFGS